MILPRQSIKGRKGLGARKGSSYGLGAEGPTTSARVWAGPQELKEPTVLGSVSRRVRPDAASRPSQPHLCHSRFLASGAPTVLTSLHPVPSRVAVVVFEHRETESWR